MEFRHRRSLTALANLVLERWPEHNRFLSRRFQNCADSELDTAELVAELAVALGEHVEGGVVQLCLDYRFLCEELVLPEEVYFRRTGSYRLSSFAEAFQFIYSNETLMRRYMNGLLLSNVFWQNHTQVIRYYRDSYLTRLPSEGNHLEIGPGHGLFLYLAIECNRKMHVHGWDISETSIARTRLALTAMNVQQSARLEVRDLFGAGGCRMVSYDSIVLSEILEHLEDPGAALAAIREHLKPGGLAFVNVPANSPAPDHIYLVAGPQDAVHMIMSAGFELVDSAFFFL